MRKVENSEFPEADRVDGCPHPRQTYKLLGHQAAEKLFLSAMENGRQHHAWLITGPKGVGKATLAYRMIRYLLGAKPLLEGSLDCDANDPVSQRIAAQGHGNVFVLRRPYDHKTKKIKSEIPVDEARKLKEFLTQMPSEAGWRIVLVDSMNEMNRNSENSILKSLEEPPEKTMFFLLSDCPGRLLPTIRSRCVSLRLGAVDMADIEPWLGQVSDHDGPIITAATKLSHGAPGRAFALAQLSNEVLSPLTKYIASLTKLSDRVDVDISQLYARVGKKETRMFFWECLADILAAQAIYCETGLWQSAFKPLPVQKETQKWLELSGYIRQLARQMDGLNMEPQSVMLTALNEIRAA